MNSRFGGVEVVPLEEEHLKAAAALIVERYRRLRERVPSLPSRYAEATTLLPLLRKVSGAGPGVAAIRGGQLVGFLAGWLMPSFRGKRTAFSPEWANGTVLEDSRRIYETMYTRLSAAWIRDGTLTHMVSLLANHREGIEGWHWLGYGMIAADAVRDLRPIPGRDAGVDVQLAGPRDLDQVMALNEALCQHLAAAPTFLVDDEERSRKTYEEWLGDPSRPIWIACRGPEAVAYLGLGPASEDAGTVIRDGKTTSVTGAFVREEARGTGVAAALLDRALEWARSAGYERCAVDFEPMNPLATRFWLRHFEPVCVTLLRHVDERVEQ